MDAIASRLAEAFIPSASAWAVEHCGPTQGFLFPKVEGNVLVRTEGTPPLKMSPKAFGLAVTLETLNQVTLTITSDDNPQMLADYLFDRHLELKEIAYRHPSAVDILKIIT